MGSLPKPTPEERRLLQMTFDRFRPSAVWPAVRELQQDLDAQMDLPPLSVREVGNAMSAKLGRIEQSPEVTFKITLFGMSFCAGAEEDIANVIAVMRSAYRRYAAGDRAIQITSQDIETELGFDKTQMARLQEILQMNGWLPGLGGGGGSWYRDINEDIREFGHITTSKDLFGFLAEITFRKTSDQLLRERDQQDEDRIAARRVKADRLGVGVAAVVVLLIAAALSLLNEQTGYRIAVSLLSFIGFAAFAAFRPTRTMVGRLVFRVLTFVNERS